MEIILPFIIAAIVFGFQIYANLKKEQEKAKKRNPSQRPKGEVVVTYGEPEQYQQTKELRKRRDKEVLVERKQPEIAKKYERFTGVLDEANEIRRKREIRPTHNHHSGRLNPYVIDEDNINPYANFDLRDAVIKAAILERPYKD